MDPNRNKRHRSNPWTGKFYSGAVLLLFLNPLLFLQCNKAIPLQVSFPYNVHKPDQKYVLEQKLAEVSGLSFMSDHEVALIQDEAGSIFIYDLNKNTVTRKIHFSGKGDYEDLKVLGDSAYILRSDGKLFQLTNLNDAPVENKLSTPLTSKNNTEGLCYDEKNGTLLIACKGSPDIKNSGKDYKNQKAIYSFDLRTGLLTDTPSILIDVNDVRQMTKGTYNNFVEKLIHFYTKSGMPDDFEPSGISIQPSTRDIYVISSVGKLLVILDHSGKLLKTIKLPSSVFKQPEGIAFDGSGNLYISNEGRNGNGNILRFNIQKDRIGFPEKL